MCVCVFGTPCRPADLRIIRFIGSGGFADCYLARWLGVDVAVKCLRDLPGAHTSSRVRSSRRVLNCMARCFRQLAEPAKTQCLLQLVCVHVCVCCLLMHARARVRVCVCVFHAQAAVKELLREASVLSGLRHPNGKQRYMTHMAQYRRASLPCLRSSSTHMQSLTSQKCSACNPRCPVFCCIFRSSLPVRGGPTRQAIH